MHIGYCDDAESHNWGNGFPVKVGIVIEWDSIAFWRKVHHKHKPDRWNTFNREFNAEIVNSRCDRCRRWFVIATGKLHKQLNAKERSS